MATEAEIKTIIELYVGYFNRVPDTAGLNFNIDLLDNNSLVDISNSFYNAAISSAIPTGETKPFYELTGYGTAIGAGNNTDYIKQLYTGVLGREFSKGDVTQGEVDFWVNELTGTHNDDKGALAVAMIDTIRSYPNENNGFSEEIHASATAARDQFQSKVTTASHYAYKNIFDNSSSNFSGTYQESIALLAVPLEVIFLF
jgi:hypothetical protein